jgi:flagellar motor switch protein FliN/FliY
VEHVKVKVSVTLGGSEMPLGKLFSLSNGDVVALDRDVDAPVDVRLHGKLIARGHLVAVGDKFGVRVSEIVTS